MNYKLVLSDKDFKATLIKICQQEFTNSLESNEKLQNLSKEIQIVKKNQMKTIELKTALT